LVLILLAASGTRAQSSDPKAKEKPVAKNETEGFADGQILFSPTCKTSHASMSRSMI
jgi:hypothetical protein